jgi:broad specificity phosphatase PhoE
MGFAPAQIVLFRHAEKPGTADLDEAGGDPHLSTRGYCRAAAIGVNLAASEPKPDLVIATQVSTNSSRPIETVTPLAQKLGLNIHSKYSDKQYAELAQELLSDPKYAGKHIAVCWHHGKIPELAQALGVTPPWQKWPAEVFDRFWVIRPDAKGQPVLTNLPQQLLYLDSAG